MDRRQFFQVSGAVAGSALLLRGHERTAAAAEGYTPVETPNGSTLKWRVAGGVKIGHLVAAPLEHEIAPGLVADCWGYNGGTPGPTLEAVEGDRVRVYVTNRLPEPTSVHWHGMIVPNGMDGVSGLTQPAIPPGATFRYDFTLRRAGTYMYHPHYDEMTQMALGMVGMFVVHPRARGPRIDRDFALMTHEWRIRPGTRRPDPTAMADFNVLTFNSRAYPGTAPLVVRTGDRVRIRFGNLSAMEHHPMHLHGFVFRVLEGGHEDTTVLVPVGNTRTIDFVADHPGDWALHCHMTHHTMNQMGHDVPVALGAKGAAIDAQVQPILPGYMTMGEHGLGGMDMGMPVPPNSIPMKGGDGPFGVIDMGGMFTILKVRDDPARDGAGWYRHPPGTVAREASAAELAADGIDAGGVSRGVPNPLPSR